MVIHSTLNNINNSKSESNYIFEFHIAAEIREKYNFNKNLFSSDGNYILADFNAAREFAYKFNSDKSDSNKISAGEINAIGLIDEIYHSILSEYEKKINPNVFSRAIQLLKDKLGKDGLTNLLEDFVKKFPPMVVYDKEVTPREYLSNTNSGVSNKEVTLNELILLYFANFNKANNKVKTLFDEDRFTFKINYYNSINHLENLFKKEVKIPKTDLDVFEFLKLPFLKYPNDLQSQLDYIFNNWGVILSDVYRKRILKSKDLFNEENIINLGGGTPPIAIPFYDNENPDSENLTLGKSKYKFADFFSDFSEPEKFSPDTDWMPNVILVAKNVFVWLDQLSKKYRRPIKHLDNIPEEEFIQLKRWNINSLWLIGLWERSSASKRIKHIMGNLDAEASAYSIYDYKISHELGGEIAFEKFKKRAADNGIRLASDMVPNHTGIYSDWMINHPEYFIQADKPPYPNYTFTGENLSQCNDVEIRIEDNYLNKTDAAVVLQRKDKRTNNIKYIYHGNDGTHMPWNDTAQLNYLLPEVREAVIQKIIIVAKKFPIIRFDAAMTLAKRHYSRLWFPEPGKGGDIPSRSDYSMSKSEFDEVFPIEFWREVVDRISIEAPDTLLLAEAFWLMEGYFVRSLGMHRVYNSAFMNLLMGEENDKFQNQLKNTLEFQPEILKRYVNFISNPDEETAISQFGDGDKYFGVCTLMVTLPGLPMFAHGQIEGLTEKYGMEYKRSYFNETPEGRLVERHLTELIPLMRRRNLFSDVKNFWHFNFYNSTNSINSNVIAFVNNDGNDKVIVLYNNSYERALGSIKNSTGKLNPNNHDEQIKINISEFLGIESSPDNYYLCRNPQTNREFIFSSTELIENGFQFELNGYETKVLWGFEKIVDSNGVFDELKSKSVTTGLNNVRDEINKKLLAPIHDSLELLLEPLSKFKNESISEEGNSFGIKFKVNRFNNFIRSVYSYVGSEYHQSGLNKFELGVKSFYKLVENNFDKNEIQKTADLNINNFINLIKHISCWDIKFNAFLSLYIARNCFEEEYIKSSNYILNRLKVHSLLQSIFNKYGLSTSSSYSDTLLIHSLLRCSNPISKLRLKLCESKSEIKFNKTLSELTTIINDINVQKYLGLNIYNGIWFYSKEKFEELALWICVILILEGCEKEPAISYYNYLLELSKASLYKFEELKKMITKNMKLMV